MPVPVDEAVRYDWDGQVPTGETVVGFNVKRVLTLVGVALVVFFILTNPGGASSTVQSIGTTLYNAAQSVTTFFTNLV